MPWDPKCPEGGPEPFDATAAVNAADFSDPVFVQVSDKEKLTKKVFTFYQTGGFRICIVADVHRKDTSSPWDIAGHCYIPGWQNWQIKTPEDVVAVAGAQPEGGKFPGAGRYPVKDKMIENSSAHIATATNSINWLYLMLGIGALIAFLIWVI